MNFHLNIFLITLKISKEVLLYTLLYAYFLGFLNQPYPLGILSPDISPSYIQILYTNIIL